VRTNDTSKHFEANICYWVEKMSTIATAAAWCCVRELETKTQKLRQAQKNQRQPQSGDEKGSSGLLSLPIVPLACRLRSVVTTALSNTSPLFIFVKISKETADAIGNFGRNTRMVILVSVNLIRTGAQQEAFISSVNANWPARREYTRFPHGDREEQEMGLPTLLRQPTASRLKTQNQLDNGTTTHV
jgi:hypothetical protein